MSGICVTAFVLAACGPSVEESIAKLGVLPYGDEPGSISRYQDLVEFFFDRNLDKKTISVMKVNSAGAVRDGLDGYKSQRDHSWDAGGSAATYVGDDFWSVEFELRWDRYNPRPVPGEVSGVDFHRLFRAAEWSQTFRGYDGNDVPGYLLYQ